MAENGVKLNADGSTTFVLPGKTTFAEDGTVGSEGAGVTITLPPVSCGDLLDFWLDFDKLQEKARPAPDANGAAPLKTVEVLTGYAAFIRKVLYTGGNPRIYREVTADDGTVSYEMTRDDLVEPGWFMSPNLLRDLLGHWQSSPLDRSSDLEPIPVAGQVG